MRGRKETKVIGDSLLEKKGIHQGERQREGRNKSYRSSGQAGKVSASKFLLLSLVDSPTWQWPWPWPPAPPASGQARFR